MIRLLLFVFLFGNAGYAQERVIAALSGLGPAGQDTIILELSEQAAGQIDILIARRDNHELSGNVTLNRIAGALYFGASSLPFLERLDTGAVLIGELGCFACGRYHSTYQITVDYHNGDWQVVSYVHSYVDRIEPWRFAHCDVNLTDGIAKITLAENATEQYTIQEKPILMTELSEAYSPKICARTNLTDAEWLALKPADWDE